jgi:hypothetical protein
MQNFKKGEYVVLLSYPASNISWESMPLNCCYKLSADSNTFDYNFELDIEGIEHNGWSISGTKEYCEPYSYTTFRRATLKETQEYEKLGRPFRVGGLHPKEENYDYLIPIMKKFNAR